MKDLKITKYGIGIVLFFSGLTIIFFIFYKPVSLVFMIILLFSVYFFRDPERTINPATELIVSPADGTILNVDEDVDEPLFFNKRVKRISIFMSLFNVHINRVPIAGEIKFIKYNKGKFFNASWEKASKYNENNFWIVKGEHIVLGVRQISGVIARRIVFTKKSGEIVPKGSRIGLIKFGSRVEIYYEPGTINLKIQPGDAVKGGETIIGEIV